MKIEVIKKMIRIELEGSKELPAYNALVENILQVLKAEDEVRNYINRGDFFIVFPQNNILVNDLAIDIKKLLGL